MRAEETCWYNILHKTARQFLTAENHSWQLTRKILGVAVGSVSIRVARFTILQISRAHQGLGVFEGHENVH
jgi:hypothetical protein